MEEPTTQSSYTVVALIDGEAGAANGPAVTLAQATAAAHEGRLVLADVLAAAEGQSLSELATPVRARREALLELGRSAGGGSLAEAVVRVGHDRWAELLGLCRQEHADLLILPVNVRGTAEQPPLLTIAGARLQQAMDETPCDLALVCAGPDVPGSGPLPLPERLLLPVRGGPYAHLALGLGSALADRAPTADVTLLHVLRPDLPEAQRAAEEAPFERFLAQIGPRVQFKRRYGAGRDVSRAILGLATTQDWLVMGLASPGVPPRWQTHETDPDPAPPSPARTGFFSASDPLAAVLGEVPARIVQHAPGPVVLVRTRRAAWPEIETLRGTAQGHIYAPTPDALSALVDKWFAENTFSADEFADLALLVEKKRRQGLTISLGLPALNEEATVGRVIEVLKRTMMDEVPLLDEIVLIDSGSTDRTVAIAEALGVPVVDHRDLLPEAGAPLRGKGEALWKSLAALKGDIIVWVDTDIENIGPQFVYGLIGPLLAEPRIQYVKGYYRRPIRTTEGLAAEGGGRVTELTIRPLFNLFYPALTGLIQPLAGEYAGRRAALEAVPFFSGYGVETGLLIDLLDQFGLSAIAQVNLGERVHRNQTLGALSVMSFAIIQVVLQRLEERQRVHFLEDVNRSMKLIHASGGQLHLELRAVRDVQRPPVGSLSAYEQIRAAHTQERTAQAAAVPATNGAHDADTAG
jgi:glucosyl-3-phosphoglycerate synthase